MAFPETKIFNLPKGWKKLGQVKGIYKGDDIYIFQSCAFCKSKAHVGREEDGEVFKYCPTCMIKLHKKGNRI